MRDSAPSAQLVKYDQIPKMMVDAVLAIEDRRFFQHGGVNFIRLAEATWIDVTHRRHEQGGSTLTMQLSRAFFLTPEKTVKRKIVGDADRAGDWNRSSASSRFLSSTPTGSISASAVRSPSAVSPRRRGRTSTKT